MGFVAMICMMVFAGLSLSLYTARLEDNSRISLNAETEQKYVDGEQPSWRHLAKISPLSLGLPVGLILGMWLCGNVALTADDRAPILVTLSIRAGVASFTLACAVVLVQ